MRRDRDAENGIVEHMVAGLMAAHGQALGVTPGVAQLRGLPQRLRPRGAARRRPGAAGLAGDLLWASRFWQIESLYRANAKYQPEWVPRFVCFRSSADLPRVSVAALRAEAFLIAPGLAVSPSPALAKGRTRVGPRIRPR